MNESITKALQTSLLLDSDLRDIYKSSIDKNDALLVLAGQMIEQLAKITNTLSQLERT
jgi:hypothetical protein